MQTLKKLFFLSLVIIFSSTVQAQTIPGNFTKLTHIIVGSTGHVYLYVEGADAIGPNTCTTNTTRYVIPKDHLAYDAMYSLALAAFHAQHEVKPTVLDDTCIANSPVVTLLNTRLPTP